MIDNHNDLMASDTATYAFFLLSSGLVNGG